MGRSRTSSRPDAAQLPRRLANLGDVAALAGVSRSTVSNVVRGSDVVAPATRRRVMAAIEQLGYRPNALARQLLRGRAMIVGVIAHDLRNPFVAEMTSFIEQRVAPLGFATLLCATGGDAQRERGTVAMMLEHRVSGVVFLSNLTSPAEVASLIGGRLPTVFISAEEPWSDSVAVDDRRGGELVARHLLGLGHRRLAFVGPGRFDSADERRLEGFARAAGEAGVRPAVIKWDPPHGDVVLEESATTWEHIMRARHPITAVFAANDFAAIDLLDVADASGVRVPARLSIVGFDDVDLAGMRRINLTTVRQPREDLVRLGIDLLLGRIDGRSAGHATSVHVGVDLRLRGTTAAPPADTSATDTSTAAGS